MRKYKLGDIATVEISGVDKKIKDGEKEIRLCNFVERKLRKECNLLELSVG